jgi:mannose-1-phosphate guanylyltransferase/mannose-6-phosphate isomerase
MAILPVILAGGGGSRLWPLSRGHYPKQFLNLSGGAGDQSLLQQTLSRLDGMDSESGHSLAVKPAIIVSNEDQRFLVAEQARLNEQELYAIILEPKGRNSAPALTVAAIAVHEDGGDPVILMMPSDHVIRDLDAFHSRIREGAALAEQGYLITFGIVPDKPETGYGYIRQGAAISGSPAHELAAFVEKPDRETAESYLKSGEYSWNSGIFMMKASVWLEAIKTFRQDIFDACFTAYLSGSNDGDFYRLSKEAFEACPEDSVDYAVMEKLSSNDKFKSAVVSLDAGWSDIGSWSSLWDISDQDEVGNVTTGDVFTHDAHNNLIVAEHRFTAVVGCDDLVVVETPDAVMVVPKEKAQDVKRIVEFLKEEKRDEHLMHRRVLRPWGDYEGIDAGERYQVKRITVKPGERLSLQMHHHRAEHWIVVSGTAKVTQGEKEFLLTENQSTYIPLGITHRLENPGTIPLELIEVQSGSYLGEDDIVRFEDIYNRA